MSILMKVGDGDGILSGYAYVWMFINCDEHEIIFSDTEFGRAAEKITCVAKTIKPQCDNCGLTNPKKLSKLKS